MARAAIRPTGASHCLDKDLERKYFIVWLLIGHLSHLLSSDWFISYDGSSFKKTTLTLFVERPFRKSYCLVSMYVL